MEKNSILFINSGSLPMPPVSGGAIQQVLYNIAMGLANRNWTVGILSTTNEDSKIAQHNKIKWHDINNQIGSGNIRDIMSSMYQVKKALYDISKHEYKSVVIFDPYIAPIIKKWNKDIKIIWSVHNTRKKTTPFIKYWTKDVNAIISVSNFLKKSIDQVTEKKDSYVVYNPLPDKWFDIESENRKRKNSILYCGRLVKEKGVHILIEALAQLPDELKDTIILGIAGATHFSGSEETAYSRSVKKLLQDSGISCEILGYIDNKDLPSIYDEYEILVVPSNWEEPATLVAGEGQSRNCILVATNAGGLPELVAPPWRELIANKGDTQSLKESIMKAIAISNEEHKIQVQDWLKENLSNETRVDKWVEILTI